jgi:hypothetical protein
MASLQNNVPAWGSYLYQNFLLPAFSPNISTEWLNLNSPFGTNNAQGNPDYFSQAWGSAGTAGTAPSGPQDTRVKVESIQPAQQAISQPGPSSFYPQPFYYNSSIATSLLVGTQLQASGSSSSNISPSVEVIDSQIVRSPSPLDNSAHITPHLSPKLGSKRRASSFESDMDHSHDEHEHEVPEGVERDGMIWGMKVEDYRALSARERKRVRNRISARTFRAKRKGMCKRPLFPTSYHDNFALLHRH